MLMSCSVQFQHFYTILYNAFLIGIGVGQCEHTIRRGVVTRTKSKHEWEYLPHIAQDRHYSQNVGNVRYIWKPAP